MNEVEGKRNTVLFCSLKDLKDVERIESLLKAKDFNTTIISDYEINTNKNLLNLSKSNTVIAFISRNSISSPEFIQELNNIVGDGRNFISFILNSTEIPTESRYLLDFSYILYDSNDSSTFSELEEIVKMIDFNILR